jgi:CHASE3 domain sensor protein
MVSWATATVKTNMNKKIILVVTLVIVVLVCFAVFSYLNPDNKFVKLVMSMASRQQVSKEVMSGKAEAEAEEIETDSEDIDGQVST